MPPVRCDYCKAGFPDVLPICPHCAHPAPIRESPEHRLDREQRERVARMVFWYIKRHPLVQPILEAGHQVITWHHPEAIWAVAVRNKEGTGHELEARVNHPGWWRPVLDTEEDWAARLTTRLAKGIRKQWDARGG